MRATGYIFTYLIGAVFAVGGLLFLLFLDENRLLFGIPYLVIGILLIAGAYGGWRRRKPGEHGG